MDDDTYLKMDYRAYRGAAHKDTRLEDTPTILKEKFSKRALIWLAIFTCGQQSETFIKNESMDASLCLKKCLKMQLLPFIR